MAHILIIKHGALGDIYQAFSAFDALRHAFLPDHLSLLTQSSYVELAQASPWFDDVLVDDRPRFTDWRAILKLQRCLRRFDRVFDLQNSGRTRRYFYLAGCPPWSGQIPQARFPHGNPIAREMHTLSRHNDQLTSAGIPLRPRHIPTWLAHHGPILPSPYIVLVPGAATHRPAKRWPRARFVALAQILVKHGLHPVIVGDHTQKSLGDHISTHVPHVTDLTGQTSLLELSGILYRASLVIGNDTGPMHIAATMDTPTLTLFSHESDPRRCSPLSLTAGHSQIILTKDLAQLSVERVIAYLASWMLPQLEPQLKSVQNPSHKE